MMKEETKTVRIEVPLIAVIRGYSDGSVSDGIWAMEHRIRGESGARVVSGLGVVPTIVQAPHDEAYWERLRGEVKRGLDAVLDGGV